MATSNSHSPITPHCPHMPAQTAFNIAGYAIQNGLLEIKMLDLYTRSLRMSEEGRALNRVGYHGEFVSIFEKVYGKGRLLDAQKEELFGKMPENHAGLEMLIREQFPRLYRDIQGTRQRRN